MRSFLLVFLLLLAPALYLYSAENPPSPQRQTNLPANQSLGDDPPVTVELLSLRLQHRAEQGDVEAQYLIALSYGFGLGVAQDYVEARKWYLNAAEQGSADAQFNLGIYYHDGQGVPQDYVEARKWYLKAAEQGHADAQFNLGSLYSNGQGVPQDYVEAREWWLKAAEQGDASAQHNLGLLYATGEGVPQDYVEARKWYLKAAEQGHADAQFNLGPIQPWLSLLQWPRRPAEVDYVTAYAWANIAAVQGDETAKRSRDLLSAELDPTSLVEAQKLSKDYFKLYVEPFQ